MIVFPNCKINLGLHITAKRADGYHDLETVFYPVPLKDALEIVTLPAEKKEAIEFTQSGLSIEGAPTDNICIKAIQLLRQHFRDLPGIRVHLHKQIPMGAGLGGGSADAAFLLQAIDKKFNLGINPAKLSELALQLGSDCPFFLLNTPSLARGRGEKLEAINVSLKGYKILLINPGIHVSTATAFKGVQPQPNQQPLKEIIELPLTQWKKLLKNQFEETVFPQYPALQKIKEELYTLGAIYAAMSGSGSTLFGIFENSFSLPINFANRYPLCKEFTLS